MQRKSKHSSKKIGRNDPCLCGSGKKYKNCCLAKDEANRGDVGASGPFPDPNIGPLDGGVWGLAKRGGSNWANIIDKIKK